VVARWRNARGLEAPGRVSHPAPVGYHLSEGAATGDSAPAPREGEGDMRQMCANGCGCPSTVPPGRGTRRGSTARRRAKAMKGHDLCRECWSALLAAAAHAVVPGFVYPHPPVGQ